VDARALALSTFVHVCAAAALGRTFAPSHAAHETSSATARADRAISIEVPDAFEVDAPKARPNGSLAGSDLAGAVRASGPNRARDGSRGDETTSEGTADARFGMVTVVASSRDVTAAGHDATWAPRAGGGADGLYAGSAFGEGVGVSGLGIGAVRDGRGVGTGDDGARGMSGAIPGALSNGGGGAWSETTWHTNYAGYGNRHARMGPRIGHPTRLAPIGPLDGALVVRIVRNANAKLVRCYAETLETRPELAGELRVDFMTDREGDVVGVKDGGGSASSDAALVTCMTKAFAALAFPKAPGLTRVAYVMTLYPR
jgi:hypothetical protein